MPPSTSQSFQESPLKYPSKFMTLTRLSALYHSISLLSKRAMPFQYKHVLMVGATAGIGKAMAERLIQEGSKVTVVGRRKERLDEFVAKYGEKKAQAAPFDISKMDKIPQFAVDVMGKSPDIDCVFLNAGIQGVYDFAHPEKVDLAKFFVEINTNFASSVALAYAFLPLLQKQTTPTGLIFTGTHLALVPAVTMPAYSASKAALNTFIMCLREQLKTSASSVKVVELWPPPVQTELHDYMGDHGRKVGMPLDVFTDQAYEGLAAGKEHVVIGSVGPPIPSNPITPEKFNEIIDKRKFAFDTLSNFMLGRA